jgi:hypothetical protein
MMLAEFTEALRAFRYRLALWDACRLASQHDSERAHEISLKMPGARVGMRTPGGMALWFEFEAMLACAAGLLDRLGKVMALSYPALTSGRLDGNVKKLPTDSRLQWRLRPDVQWLRYLADLRNVSLHRVLLSHAPDIAAFDGMDSVLLPDHECLRDRSVLDPRELSYSEGFTMASVVATWRSRVEVVVAAVLDDYFVRQGR